MNCRNPIATLCAIVAIACLANATQPIGARLSRCIHVEVGENHSGNALNTSTLHHRQSYDSKTVQLLYRFGTKSLSINCSSAHCLVVLSNAGEA